MIGRIFYEREGEGDLRTEYYDIANRFKSLGLEIWEWPAGSGKYRFSWVGGFGFFDEVSWDYLSLLLSDFYYTDHFGTDWPANVLLARDVRAFCHKYVGVDGPRPYPKDAWK